MAGPLHSTRASGIGAVSTTDVLTPAVLVREGLYRLTNRLVIASLCRRYTDQIFNYDVTAGICYIKKPFYATLPGDDSATGNRGLTTFQEVSDRMIEVEIDTRKRVGFSFYDTDRTLSIVDWTSRYVSSGIEELAEVVEEDAVKELVDNPYYQVTGSTIGNFTAKTCLEARAYAEDQSIPSMNNYCVINPADYVSIADDFRDIQVGLPDSSMMSAIVTSHYKGMLADFKVYTSNKIPFYNANAITGTELTNGTPGNVSASAWAAISGADGSNDRIWNIVPMDGATAGTIKKGTIFTLPGIYERQVRGSRNATNRLFKFVVQADTSLAGASTASHNVPVQEYSVGNPNVAGVSTAPGDGAAPTWIGGTGTNRRQQIFWHRDAMNMVSPSLVTPDGAVESGKATDDQTGISLQYVKDYNITTGQSRLRIDTIYGFKMLRPEMALRNLSSI